MFNPIFNLFFTVISAGYGRLKSIFENRILPIFGFESSKDDFIEAYTGSMCVIDNKTDRQLLSAVKYKDTNFIPATDQQGNIYYVDGKTVPKRCAENVETWTMLPLDLDENLTIQSAEKLYEDHEFVLSTSFNHTEEHHKFHIFMFLKEPVSAADFDARTDAIKEFIGGADLSSISKSQGFFLPSCSEENKDIAQVFHSKGEPLDLMSFPINKPKPIDLTKRLAKRDIEVNITSLPDAARNYLNEFISEKLWSKGHHSDIRAMAASLKSFNYPEHEAIELLKSFKSCVSNENVESPTYYDGIEAKYGHIGVLINLFKDHFVYSEFDIKKFNRLAGIVKLSTIKGDLSVFEPENIQEILLSNRSFLESTETEGLVEFENFEQLNKLSKVLTDNDFPLGITYLNSPTNSGKTYMFINTLTGMRILLVPTKALVDQVAKEKGIAKCYEGFPFPIGEPAVVMTYDQIGNFIKLVNEGKIKRQEYDLFVDEAHNLYTSYSYRKYTMNKVYNAFQNKLFRKVVLMSGTLKPEFLPKLKVKKQINVVREEPEKQVCHIIKTNDWQQFIRIKVKINGKTIILLNDKKLAEEMANYFNEQGIKSQVLHTDNQEDYENQLLLLKEEMGSNIKVLFMTQLGVEGLNFNDEDIEQIIAVGHHKSATLEQLTNRARKRKPKLYVTRSLNTEEDGFLSQIDIKAALHDASLFVTAHNSVIGRLDGKPKNDIIKTLKTLLEPMPSYISDSVIFNEYTQQFEVSNLGIGSAAYEIDGRNESYNAQLFDKHMSEYHFEVTRETIEYKDLKLSKEINKSKRKKEAKEIEDNQLGYLKAMADKVESVESLRYFANAISKGGYPELLGFKDEFEKSAILANHYALDDVMELMVDHIKDKKAFDHAMEYAKQTKQGSPYRDYFESVITIGQRYFDSEIEDIFNKGTLQLNEKYKVKFDKATTKNKRTRTLARLFTMESERVRVNGNKNKSEFHWCSSYNPIGKEVISLPKGEADKPATLLFKGKLLIPENMKLSI